MENVSALVPEWSNFYGNEESKFAKFDWSKYHCPDWLESCVLIGPYGDALFGQ